MKFKNKDYFREPYFASEDFDLEDFEIEKLEATCLELKSKKHGLNHLKEKCLRGVRATYFEDAGLIYEPIIFNLDTKEILIDYKVMLYNKEQAKKYELKMKTSPLCENKKNICFIFFDGQLYHEFLFTKKIKPVNFLKSLEQIFYSFIKC